MQAVLSLRLHDHLASLRFPTNEREQRALRDDVCAYVDECKADGWTPERVIVSLKDMARAVGIIAARFESQGGLHAISRDALLSVMVDWCIDQYYQPAR